MTSKLTITDERIEKIAVWLATESHSLNLEMLTCLRELQERRKAAMDSKPVAEVVSVFGDSESIGERELKLLVGIQNMPYGTKFYRHAQPAPDTEREPIAWLNDAYLARGVVDGEAGSEDAGPGYIPVYREASPAQPVPVVPDEKPIPNPLNMYAVDAVAAIAEVRGWNACRAAMLATVPQG
nr:Uncharacterised protein [Raoultella sp. NCTC 9187]